ncbi:MULTISPECIES: hypothetical protein [Leptolyngbya]|uniref:hypothetical protein n=1 Tax=Leptolyngbya TaxID=47251 RepID=UPI0016857B69|nr:hypothetical protein [Leptolyngbya sp. FACHB-1624]MBD1860021.1 hypothetical protein [Leptolyngbya sp. FACHB-1624]
MSDDFALILSKAQFSLHFVDWALPTTLVAEGFGCTAEAVRSHKTRNASELREGKHWVKVTDPDNIARIYWSRRGIVRLGFLIDSDRARAFRDAAEDFILSPQTEPEPVPLIAPDTRCNVQQRRSLQAGIAIFTGVAEVFVIVIAFSYAVILAPFWVGGGVTRE